MYLNFHIFDILKWEQKCLIEQDTSWLNMFLSWVSFPMSGSVPASSSSPSLNWSLHNSSLWFDKVMWLYAE